MAVSLTASTTLQIQRAAVDMWQMARTQNGTQYQSRTNTLEKVIKSQTMRTLRPVMDDAGICTGWKIWWIDKADLRAQTAYSGTVPNPAAACDLAPCAPLGTNAKVYNHDLFLDDCYSVSDDDCSNDAKFAMLVADGLNEIMDKMRGQLNKRVVENLFAKRSDNLETAASPNIGGTLPAFTINTTLHNTAMSAAALADAGILVKYKISADFNRIPEYLILDGTNLLFQTAIAPYLGLNDDQRSVGALFAEAGKNYTSDIDLPSITGRASTLLVNPNGVGFYNFTKYASPVAQDIDTSKGLKAFKIADPVLMFASVSEGGQRTMKAVEYDVIYQKVCSGMDANGFPKFMHTFKVKFTGGMPFAPAADNGSTGILEFVKA